ncbi:hypothetical protein N7510_010777 [Penicillium lagena]|uniref:uncharacterized protein n=1 Tax=Penicillium lagena TaxID=94218 RepID=UPI002542676A|nr:uncharacterized protein N7510_010777 [Penicillium lagena]KAJ5601243.1 hypothetical protein N7510_010777 [Penicillium lagena]
MHLNLCGCHVVSREVHSAQWSFLPQISLKAHATILSSVARTTLTQVFANPSDQTFEEVQYNFPLYDGVSVVGFKCHVGTRFLRSQVKTKDQATADFKQAVSNDQSAALLEYGNDADVFKMRLGNVRAGEKVTVEITFVGDLRQDAQTDGVRYMLPNAIAPRYGSTVGGSQVTADVQGISITVDVLMDKNSIIRELQSPSHSIKASLGRISVSESTAFEPSQASATLNLSKGNVLLTKDFVLLAKADGLDEPRAMVESHSAIPGQRAVMATLVPKFNLPRANPEIVFVLDRSGSMGGKIGTLRSALKVFLKSLPVGTCFNICSFGSHHEFLWSKSRVYDEASLQEAMFLAQTLAANFGGTEMLSVVEAVVKNRLENKSLEVLLLTDGQIHNEQKLFNFVRQESESRTAPTRFFSLGIGDAASSALIEGIARNGNGISQSVLLDEELDRKVIRMLKGALYPHLYSCRLDVEYEGDSENDFELVQGSETETQTEDEQAKPAPPSEKEKPQTPISLFDENFQEDHVMSEPAMDHLPTVNPPTTLQAPYNIPALFPFIRTSVYLLIDPQSPERVPRALTFHATCSHGPLKLQIPIQDIGKGELIHHLASRKAVIELEEGHGWLSDAKDAAGNPIQLLHPDSRKQLETSECQRLGLKYQVTGKYCSFIALEEDFDEVSNGQPNKVFEVTERPMVKDRTNIRAQMAMAQACARPRMTQHAGPFGAFSPQTYQQNIAFQARPPPAPPIGPFSGGNPFGHGFCAGPSSGLQHTSGGSVLSPNAQNQAVGGRHPLRVESSQPTQSLFGAASPDNQWKCLTSAQHCPPLRPPLQASSLFGSAHAPGDQRYSAHRAPLFGSAHAPGDQRYSAHRAPLFGSAHALGDQPFSARASLFGNSQNATPKSPANRVHAIIGLQTFEGIWKWSKELFDLLDTDENQVTKYMEEKLLHGQNMIPQSITRVLVATLLAMGFLKNKNQGLKSTWELVYGKAEDWVDRQLDDMVSLFAQTFKEAKEEIMALA